MVTRWKWCWVLPTRSRLERIRIPWIWKRSSSTCGSFVKDECKSVRGDALLPTPTRFSQAIRLLSAVEPRTAENEIEVHIV